MKYLSLKVNYFLLCGDDEKDKMKLGISTNRTLTVRGVEFSRIPEGITKFTSDSLNQF